MERGIRMEKEAIIRRYFRSWIDRDIDVLEQVFSDDVTYTECYGPEYHGLTQILKWFADWNRRGTVLKWEIKGFIQQGSLTAVEWTFACDYDHEIGEFDGVSLIEFDEDMKMVRVKEFQSKAEHVYPYEE